jgi:chaperonin cofactor prefoldin
VLLIMMLLLNEEAEEFVKEKAAASAKKTAELQEQRTMLIKQMDLLKAMLYQKFGKQINLENADQTRDE